MMRRLSRYVSGLFLSRWLVTTLGMLTLVSVLDSLGNADLLPEGSGLADQLRFMALRLPILFDRIFLFAMFLGILLTFLSLIRRNELVAISASGVSTPGQIRAIAPVLLGAALISAVIIDLTLPSSVRSLESWLGAASLEQRIGQTDTLWLAEPDALIEISHVQGDALSGLTFYERGGAGLITGVTEARSARWTGAGWELSGVSQQRFNGAEAPARSLWMTPQSPRSLQVLASAPRDLSLSDQFRLAQMRSSGSLPSTAYYVWAYHRLTLPLAALGFLLFAAPMMQRLGRMSTGDLALIGGMLAGFAYLVVDGSLKMISQAGTLPAWMAAAIPIGLISVIGLYMVLDVERPA